MANDLKTDDTIRLFVTAGCPHCEHIKKIVDTGRFDKENVDVIDLTTPEGAPYLDKLPVKRVPVAFKGAQECELTLTSDDDGEMLLIDCGDEEGKEV